MAKQTGVFQVVGTLGNATFYKTKDGYQVRAKSSISKARIKYDPAYERTRENCAEFARSAYAGKLFRMAFRPLLHRAGDKGHTGTLMRAMLEVMREDAVNLRGQRTVKDGEPLLLEGFEFNQKRALSYVLRTNFNPSIDRAQGAMIVDIPAFSPATVVSAPEGATHMRLFSGGAVIDFENNTYNFAMSESAIVPVRQKENVEPLQLIQKVKPGSSGTFFLLLGVEFLQVVYGKENALTISGNSLAIVKVLNQ